MKAQAVVFTDRLSVEFRDVTIPEPGPDDVVIRTRYSWISNGTEGSYLRGERINGETPYRTGDPWPFPIAPGYQSVGIIERTGANVMDFHPGDWVFCTLGRIDDMFEPCGGHISPKVVHQSQVWLLPHGLSPIAASGLVLTQVGYNCGIRPPIEIGDSVLVIGDGLVGHWAAQTLHWRGASVIMAGKHAERLTFFPSGQRTAHIDITREDLLSAIHRFAPTGLQAIVATIGSTATLFSCLRVLRHDGHLVSAGFHQADSMIDIQQLRLGEWTLHAPSGWEERRMDQTLALIASGHLQTQPLITHQFPAERANAAWDLIINRYEPVLGVVLTW